MNPSAMSHADPENEAIERENQELALRVLQSIPKRDREVLIRFYFKEESPDADLPSLELDRDPIPPHQIARQSALRRVGTTALAAKTNPRG